MCQTPKNITSDHLLGECRFTRDHRGDQLYPSSVAMASAGIASMKPNVAASIVEKMEVPGSGRSGSDEGRGRVHVSTGSS